MIIPLCDEHYLIASKPARRPRLAAGFYQRNDHQISVSIKNTK